MHSMCSIYQLIYREILEYKAFVGDNTEQKQGAVVVVIVYMVVGFINTCEIPLMLWV